MRWYKDYLSGYGKDEEETEEKRKLHEHDTEDPSLIDRATKRAKKIFVPILNLKNLGKHMAIDDKNISGVGYTIISNRETRKIFLMITTTKFKIIEKVLHHIPLEKFLKVKTITKDLAEGYDWLSRIIFPQAVRIADKFHVLKLGFEGVQAMRVRFRQEVLSQSRKKKKGCNPTYSNGDTKKELLAKSRYLLFKRKHEWTEWQEERAKILFSEFPEIEKSYELMEEFRDFYAIPAGNSNSKSLAKTALNKWYKNVRESDISEMKNFSHTVKNHEPEILAYFFEGYTNAFAESLNAKIQRFVISSFGFNNRNFFHFRLKKYFAPD
jgi:transposase